MANDYFTGDRLFWDDPDFETLEQKAVYAMLWQAVGTDIAGIRIRNDKLDCNRVCIGVVKYQDTLLQLKNKGKIGLFGNRVWIKSAIWRNLFKGACNKNQIKAVTLRLKDTCDDKLIATIIEYYKQKYRFDIPYPYPIDTLCIGVPTESESESESETESETDILSGKPDPIPYSEIIDDLNQKAKANYKSSTNKTRGFIKARWNEGFRLDDFKKVHNIKIAEWKDDPKWCKYIRPETLYGTKFESYLNQKVGNNGKSTQHYRQDGKYDSWE